MLLILDLMGCTGCGAQKHEVDLAESPLRSLSRRKSLADYVGRNPLQNPNVLTELARPAAYGLAAMLTEPAGRCGNGLVSASTSMSAYRPPWRKSIAARAKSTRWIWCS